MTIVTDTTAQIDRLYVALDLSKSSWVVVLASLGEEKLRTHRVDARTDHALGELVALIERHRAALAKRLGRPVRVMSCYEAGPDGFWLHRALSAQGIDNLVLDPASLRVDRRVRRAKTDRIDAEMLVRALMAWARGDRQACRPVHVPTPAQEDARRLGRERERLLGEKTAHTNRIESLLVTLGVRGFAPLRASWSQRLAALRDWAGQALPAQLSAEITRELERLHVVVAQLATVTRAIESRVRAEAKVEAPSRSAPGQITRLVSLGPIGADTLGHEVLWRDFANRRQIASYVGITGTPDESGQTSREQGISKAGNRRARKILVELAWLWLKHQPDSALTAWFNERTTGQHRRMRRIMIVALARKLLIALWRFLTTGLVPQGARLKA